MGRENFEKALMRWLRQRGTLRAGFIAQAGLSDDEMERWGTSLQGMLLQFESRYRGSQHLLGLDQASKEPRGFRSELKRNASGICLELLKHRERLSQTALFSSLYQAEILDVSWIIWEAAGMLIRKNLSAMTEKLSAKGGTGAQTEASWCTSLNGLEMTFKRGMASRTFNRTFEVDDVGSTLLERLDSAAALWRNIQAAIETETSKPGCWPDLQAQSRAESARAMSLMEGWMRTLKDADRQAILEHGGAALSRLTRRA